MSRQSFKTLPGLWKAGEYRQYAIKSASIRYEHIKGALISAALIPWTASWATYSFAFESEQRFYISATSLAESIKGFAHGVVGSLVCPTFAADSENLIRNIIAMYFIAKTVYLIVAGPYSFFSLALSLACLTIIAFFVDFLKDVEGTPAGLLFEANEILADHYPWTGILLRHTVVRVVYLVQAYVHYNLLHYEAAISLFFLPGAFFAKHDREEFHQSLKALGQRIFFFHEGIVGSLLSPKLKASRIPYDLTAFLCIL